LAFTFLLARHGSAWALVVACGAVSVGLLVVRGRLAAAAAAGLVAVVLAAPSAELLATVGWRWSGRVGSLAAWEESRQQRIEVAGGTPVAIYTDGALLATFPDPHRVSPRAHLALLLHGDPRRVLAVGALADGSVIPMLAHPIERLDLVEEDPALVSALPAWFGPEFAGALSDPRVRVHRIDPVRALASGGPWEVVALFDGDPVSLRRNRTRTVEFFRTCRTRLAEDGIVIVRAGVADTYLGGAGGRLLGTLFASLRAVFPQVRALPGEEVLLVAGGERATIVLDGAVLAERLVARGIDDPACPPALVAALLDVARREPLEAALAAMPAETNRAGRPGAVTLAAALHEGRTAPGLLRTLLALGSAPHWVLVVAAGLAAAGLVATGARRAGPGGEVGVTVGFVSMGLWLLLLWAWQATRGSTYAAVGALSGLFMAGVAAGSAAASRWWRDAGLIVALAGLSLTSLLVATSLPTALPGIVVPAALVLGGGLTGVAFPGLARLLGGGDSRSGAGRGFAFDEAGAAASALAVGLGLLPWAGMRTTALALASLAAAAAVGVALSASRARKCP
jgi:spermidine synthase